MIFWIKKLDLSLKCKISDENRMHHSIFEVCNFFNFRSTFWSGQFVPLSKKIVATRLVSSINGIEDRRGADRLASTFRNLVKHLTGKTVKIQKNIWIKILLYKNRKFLILYEKILTEVMKLRKFWKIKLLNFEILKFILKIRV